MTIDIVVDGETHEVANPSQAGAVVTGALLANADEVEITRDGASGSHVIDRLDQLAARERTATDDGDSEDQTDADEPAQTDEGTGGDMSTTDAPDNDEALPEFEEAVGEDDEEASDETVDCPDCDRSFDTEQRRNHHRTSVHGDRDRLSDQAVNDMDEVLEDEETESEAADLGIYEVKSYGLVFTRDVQDFFTDDAERVTVRERDGRYELVPGPSEEWPDYAVSAAGIQIGNPGKDVLGVEDGDEVVATADGNVVVLDIDADSGDEPEDDDDQDGDDDPDDEDPDTDHDDRQGDDVPDRWCGYCGAGPFEGDDGVDEHHDDEDHPGDPVVKESDPTDADWVTVTKQDSFEESEGAQGETLSEATVHGHGDQLRVQFGGGPARHFDAEQVTLTEDEIGFVLVAGEAEGHTYSVQSDGRLTLAQSAIETLGVESGDRVEAIADGDTVRLVPHHTDEPFDPKTAQGDFYRRCPKCDIVCEHSLEWFVHRTEAHDAPQSELDNLEPGEFESIVQDADTVADIFEAVPFSSGRTLRLLGVYGLDDVVGGNVELSDLTDFEFDGVDDARDQEDEQDADQETATAPDPEPDCESDRPDPDDPDFEGAAYRGSVAASGGDGS